MKDLVGAIDSMHTKMNYSLDDTKYCLAHVLRNTGDMLSYIYDMGDSWKHRIVLQDIVEPGDTVTIANTEAYLMYLHPDTNLWYNLGWTGSDEPFSVVADHQFRELSTNASVPSVK